MSRFGGDRPGPGQDGPVIRPFILTGGRTVTDLPIEALCLASERALTGQAPLSDEQQLIIRICEVPMSVAEISARTRLPLGVCRVLVGDLAASELMFVSRQTSVEVDLDLIGRLLDGIRNV